MTRYNEAPQTGWDYFDFAREGYREGVDRVREYIESINAYPKLVAELKWAIDEGII